MLLDVHNCCCCCCCCYYCRSRKNLLRFRIHCSSSFPFRLVQLLIIISIGSISIIPITLFIVVVVHQKSNNGDHPSHPCVCSDLVRVLLLLLLLLPLSTVSIYPSLYRVVTILFLFLYVLVVLYSTGSIYPSLYRVVPDLLRVVPTSWN